MRISRNFPNKDTLIVVTLCFIPFLESLVRGWYYHSWFYGLLKYIGLIVVEDARTILAIVALSILSFICCKRSSKLFRIAGVLFAILAIITNVLYVADFCVQSILSNRLFFSDIPIYLKQMFSFKVFFGALFSHKLVLLDILFCLLQIVAFIGLFISNPGKISRVQTSFAFATIVIFAVASLFPFQSPMRQAFLNVFSLNYEGNGRFAPYSRLFLENQVSKKLEGSIELKDKTSCFNPHNQKLNIIQIVFESMSVAQSKLFSDLPDNLFPKTDLLVKEKGMYFTNFFQNTYNSASGQFVSMSGHLALPNSKREYPWHNEELLKDSLANKLAHLSNGGGYSTEYIASVELDQSQLRKMAKLAGFKEIFDLNQTHPKDKLAHNDADLYEFVLGRMAATSKPFYFFVVNSTTHPPYLVPPLYKEYDYTKSFRYADSALSDFILKLEQEKFFENGILVVSSDHHPWENLTIAEIQSIKHLPEAKVPCFIIGKSIPKRQVDSLHSTVDIVPSLEWFITGRSRFLITQSNLFEGASKAIFHHNGNSRNNVKVLCNGGSEVVSLNGDQTSIVDSEEKCPINTVDVINHYRGVVP